MQDPQSDKKFLLSGHVSSIPLAIEDINTKDVIKYTSLYLRSSTDVTDSQSQFTNISLTAMNQEGTFHLIIDESNYASFKKKRNLSCEDWELILRQFFPISNTNDNSHVENLTLSAKLVSVVDYYDPETKELRDDEELALVSEFITIDIKTKAKLPVTVGSIEIPYTDSEDVKWLEDINGKEQNIFNWLDLLIHQNQHISKELQIAQKRLSESNEEKDQYKNELENNSKQHEDIIYDLQDKFYQVLNAKKDKIWALENKNLDKLEGLNEKYMCQNRLNLNNITIDKEKILDTLDETYTSPRKRKRSPSEIPRKTRKRKANTKCNDENKSDVDINKPETKSKRKEVNHGPAAAARRLSDRDIVVSVLKSDEQNTTTDADEHYSSTDYGEDTDHITNEAEDQSPSKSSEPGTDYGDSDENHNHEKKRNSHTSNSDIIGDSLSSSLNQRLSDHSSNQV